VTEPFAAMAEIETRGMNMPDLPVLVIPHPLVTRRHEELSAVADAFVDRVVDALLEQPPAAR
jgi:hypothetical protein